MTASGFYHCSVKPVGRANGRSVVAAAAYRSGERLADEITGQVADYRARGGVLDTFILTRDDASAWAHDRARLWNEAERAEPRANGRLATEFELALPHELTDAQRKQLLQDYLAPIIEKYGIAADVAIHAPGEGKDHRNTHAHVLLTHRELGADGIGDIANRRTITKKVKGQEKQIEIAGIAATPADIKAIRKEWEQQVNRAYERAGLDIRVDHRSHEDRGIEQEPTKHLGAAAAEIERRDPGASDRAKINRDIADRNAELRRLAALEAEANALAQIIEARAAEYEARRYDPLHATERAVARAQFEGRYDDLRAAEPPPEIVRMLEAAAARATEPAAPLFDRDVADAAWMDKVAAAAIAKDDAARTAQEGHQPAEPVAGMEARAAEPTHQAPPQAQELGPEPEHHGTRSLGHVFGGLLGGFGKAVVNLITELADFLAPPPPPTKGQAERAVLIAAERHEQQTVAAYDQQVRAHDDMLAEQQRTRDIARALQIEPVSDPEEDRFRLIMQRSARDRERDRDYERER
jgi:MobA/MobL family